MRGRRSVHSVAVVAVPGVLPLDLGIPVQAFGTTDLYRVLVCADPAAGGVDSLGFAIETVHDLEVLETADTVVVAGVRDPLRPVAVSTLSALSRAHTRGARMIAICTGAFVLAAAGVLNGRRATTHWSHTGLLARSFPRVRVEPDRLFVDEGDVLTSAGVMAGVDLCLHVVDRDHGASATNERARYLVAAPRRGGTQAQFVERFRPSDRGHDLAGVRAWMVENAHHRLTLGSLAEKANMAPRTLSRRFRDETGHSPLSWLTLVRIDHARELLETTDLPIESVGARCGLGSPAAARASFGRVVGCSPAEYRSMFRGALSAGTDVTVNER